MKKTLVIASGITVSYYVSFRSADSVESLINILSCMEYCSKEYSELYNGLYNAISKHLDADDNWDIWYPLYQELNYVEHEAYYDSNIDKFNEYCTHMNEPDFDWGFYSDWHKDLFGFRPRR